MSHLKFFTKPGIISPFLFNSFTTNKPRLMFAVISCNNKVNTSVNTYNITNIRNITFFNLIGNWYMQIVFTMFIYKFGSTKLVNRMVKILRHTLSKIRKFHTTIKRIDGKAVLS